MERREQIAERLERIARNEQLIYNAGVEKGKAEVGEGIYEEGFEAGKKSEYDAFWDAYQENGNRTQYGYAFYGRGWTEDTFAPKYDMQPISAASMFQYSYHSTINLKEGLAKNGVKLDFSKCTSMDNCFNYASLGDLPELDLRSLSAIPLMFYDCQSRVIDKIILKADGSQTFTNPFNTCRSLIEVRFEGVIGQKGLNFQWSTKLSHDSLVSIINALSTATSGLTVTISKTAKENAFTDEEWAALIATKPNWTISLA